MSDRKKKNGNDSSSDWKYWLAGIIGAVCFGIGDWLLGYVDPRPVNAAFTVIKAGHGISYALWKIRAALVTGAIGIPFLMAGCVRMKELLKEETGKKWFGFWMSLLPAGWMIIHFTVSVSIAGYSWMMKNADAAQAERLAMDLLWIMRPSQVISWLLAGIPLVILSAYVLRNKTVLSKKAMLYSPVLWMAIFTIVKFFVPASPFTNGIDTFCMNAGMIIWFAYLLAVANSSPST